MTDYSAIFDPLNRIDLPPARHAIESDSESEEESDAQDEVDGGPSSGRASGSARIEEKVAGVLDPLRNGHALVLIGQTGESIATHAITSTNEIARLSWEGRTQASIGQLPGGIAIILLYPSNILRRLHTELNEAIEVIFSSLQPAGVTILAQYQPSLYIRSTQGDIQAPVRYLCTEGNILHAAFAQSYSPPNYLTGVEATVLSTAVYCAIPTLALLLPNSSSEYIPASSQTNISTSIRKSRRRQKDRSNPLADGVPGFDFDEESDRTEDDPGTAGFGQAEQADPLPDELDGLSQTVVQLNNAVDEWTSILARPRPAQPLLIVGELTEKSKPQSILTFVEERRKRAFNRRREIGGMYV